MKNTSQTLIENYYKAFNAGDMTRFFELLAEDVVHDIKFMDHMNKCYKEKAEDLIIMVSEDGQQAAATFMIDGKYLNTDGNLPAATGQTYHLPVGSFFRIKDNKISQVTNYYNLNDWLAQIK